MVKGLPAEWEACFRTISLSSPPWALVCWKDFIAVGSMESPDISILNAITGIYISVLSGHTQGVISLTFSLDGTLLVSGSEDETIKLWDIQTGGVVRTFHGHTNQVTCVSISQDHTTIASGSDDKTIHLWDTETGECSCIIAGHKDHINSVSFSPTNSQLLISALKDNTVQQWDINGHKIGPTYDGSYVAFSPDGSCFISWGGSAAVVQKSGSGVVIAELQVADGDILCCCFSPNNKFVAGGSGNAIYIWDITQSTPHLVETITGQNHFISLVLSSSLISLSDDGSINFWQISAFSAHPVSTDPESTPLASASIKTVGLQANDGIAISSDELGVVRTWDVSSGLCKTSFCIPVQPSTLVELIDGRLIDERLMLIWFSNWNIYIWDTRKGEPPQIVDVKRNGYAAIQLRISGDGSKVFLLDNKCIQAWSIWTGEAVGVVKAKGERFGNLFIKDGSKVCVYTESQPQWWDFGDIGSTPTQLSNIPLNRHLLHFGKGRDSPSRIEDMATGKEVFQLSGRYKNPSDIQWDGWYLVAGYDSGEVLILDFNHILPK